MYKSKKEVDAHVRAALSKLRSETERNLRSFTIAKMYYKINEYATAEQYISSHLSVKEDNDQAHKLLGQCYQRLKKPEKALQAFQRSLQLNPKQSDVLAEVCQLLLEDKNLNVNKAKYWCDLAESEKVQDDAVFALRLKLLNKDNQESNQVEELILKEINARPNDVQLRVRLIRSYIEQEKVLDAFKYIHTLEMSQNDAFASSSEWYNIVWLVLSKYEQLPNTKKDWDFWLLLVICLERQIDISFALTTGTVSGGITETANLLFNLDQYLFKITQLSDKLCVQSELVSLFLDHFRGQLLLHAVALIFKRELLQNKNKWKETVKAVLPLLLLAFQIEPPNNKEPWMKHCDEQGKQLIQLWTREGSFRCAQAGRTLLSCIIDETTDKENAALQINTMIGNQATLWNSCDELLAQIRQTCSDKQWRRNIFALLFCNSDQKVKEQSSLLIRSPKIAEPLFELPNYAELERYEESAQYFKPQSLQHIVYLCLGNDNLAYVRVKYFSGLNFSTQNLAFCGAESLNQLDVESFLYAATIQAKRMIEVERDTFNNYNSGNRSAAGKPRILPFVNLQSQLCSEEQTNWWTAAYQVYKNLTSDNLAELRALLQFGIETVRGINGPKIDMIIVFKLGQIFVARAQDIVKPVEKAFLEARAESIYRYGLNMLKMSNKGVLEPYRKYFKYVKANTSAVEREVSALAEDAVSYLAVRFFKKSEYEELIEELTGIQLPFATYLQAEAYRKLDEVNKTPKKAKRLYLDRASECLNQTLSLLRNTQTDPNHPLNSIIHSELKRLQQANTKFLNDSINYVSPVSALHNNSSTYEDAETEFYTDASQMPTAAMSFIRSRREVAAAAALASPHNAELENLVKQIASTLSFVKDEIVDTIKPEMLSMRKEITSLKDKIANLEDAMKHTRISSNPPSRDDASHVLDDLYIIEDALQNQLYPQSNVAPTQTPQMPATFSASAMTNGNAGNIASPFLQQQQQQQQNQQRIHTPNAFQMQQNAAVVAAAAAAYNSPMFNPNYPINYYTPPFMMPPQGAANTGAKLGQRNLSLPYMDAGAGNAMNFNMPANTPLLPPPNLPSTNQDGRSSNLFSLLTQQQQQQHQPQTTAPQLPQLPVPISMPSLAPAAQPQHTGVATAATNSMPLAFNKTIKNQPVEKIPPANVVITSSDPLPNPNSAMLQTQQPTLSVTIPPHHIKSSLVQTPEPIMPTASVSQAGGFSGFSALSQTTSSPFAGFGSSSATTTATTVASFFGGAKSLNTTANTTTTTSSSIIATSSSVSTTTPFSFKPQVAQAQAQAQAHSLSNEIKTTLNTTNDSFSSEHNKSGSADPEAEYDPRPDFKPIIPLPDEIEVKTGEEDEEVVFRYRAKLFRYVGNEWKERGIGDIKILKNKNGASRILMRRDQTHKICANHKITKELVLVAPKAETKGHIWVANDFADETLRLEKFFVRFKLPETAQQFHDAFKHAQKEDEALQQQQPNNEMQPPTAPTTATVATTNASVLPVPFGLAKSATTNFATSTPSTKGSEAIGGLLAKPANAQPLTSAAGNVTSTTNASKTLFGGFGTHTSTLLTADSQQQSNDAKQQTVSPFANFSFDKSTASNAGATTVTSTNNPPAITSTTSSPFANIFSNLGKSSPFSTANLPAFQSPVTPAVAAATTTTTSTPAGLAHNKSNASETEDDYVPTAQFNPVIPLPDLVEVFTGEENDIVLFEHRAKLLRFSRATGEWKERGLGNIKLLQDKDDVNKLRLVMRREQVHKLCCNHRVYKDTSFTYAKNSLTALSWVGQVYAEKEVTHEMLSVRFKTPDICKQFHEAILKAQSNMSSDVEEENVKKQESERTNSDAQASSDQKVEKGFGDAFKPKPGAWSCSACYISNTADKLHCVACETPKDDSVPKKTSAPSLASSETATKNTFTFGFPAAETVATTKPNAAFSFGFPTATNVTSNANAFSTATAVNGNTITTTPTTTLPTILPATTTTSAKNTTTSSFGDQFKPKAGSWNCESCYLSNTADVVYCKACDAPKDKTVPKKDASSGVVDLSKPTQKFNFGFAAAGVDTNAAATKPAATNSTFSFGTPLATKSEPLKTLFGYNNAAAVSSTSEASKSFTFSTPLATSSTLGNTAALGKQTFTFTLQSKAMETPTMPSAVAGGGEANTTPFSLDKKEFNFTLKPKSPGTKAGKSPSKFGGGGGDADCAAEADGDDADYHEEEENNTYFTPVIPLPDKIEVKTGEENEELLYVHRVKLFRFIESEWKERGLGDLKILRHKETKKLRVVMRREQVLKICLNHVLNADIEYKPKDSKTWLFVAHDFSEGELTLEKFSLRFKTKEYAQEFMEAVKSALDGTAIAIEPPSANNSLNTSNNLALSLASATNNANISSNDVERKFGENLQLPHELLTAQPTCSGCRGCDPDAFVFPSVKSNEAFVSGDDAKHNSLPLELPALTLPKLNRSLLKQSTLSPAVPTKAAPVATENIFAGIANKSSNNTTATTASPATTAFSFTAALANSKADDTKTNSGGFLFGSSSLASTGGGATIFGGSGDKKPIFGQTPSIFGGTNSASDKTTSIFGGNNSISTNGGLIFGGKPIFGGAPSFFGTASNAVKTETQTSNDATAVKSIFDTNSTNTIQNNSNDNTNSNNSIFSSTTAFAGFENKSAAQTSTIFGNAGNTSTKSSSFFGSIKKEDDATAPPTAAAAPSFVDFSSKADAIDFASLAAKARTDTPTKPGEKPGAAGFIGLTNQDAFSSFLKSTQANNDTSKSSVGAQKTNDTNVNESVDDDSAVNNDENYDPHYEPIIALPNEIVVSTGEENETKLFGERATLFRWDFNTKEWKERGIGELKILLHTEKETHRLVMRREQIHKLVLNHAIGSDFMFDKMKSNPKSLIWATMNYAESSDGEYEKLAVRFKKIELAEQFSKLLTECVEAAKKRNQN